VATGDKKVAARLLNVESRLLCVLPSAWCTRWLHALHHLLHGLNTTVGIAARTQSAVPA
jgi:hypothetical protein